VHSVQNDVTKLTVLDSLLLYRNGGAKFSEISRPDGYNDSRIQMSDVGEQKPAGASRGTSTLDTRDRFSETGVFLCIFSLKQG